MLISATPATYLIRGVEDETSGPKRRFGQDRDGDAVSTCSRNAPCGKIVQIQRRMALVHDDEMQGVRERTRFSAFSDSHPCKDAPSVPCGMEMLYGRSLDKALLIASCT